MFFDRCKDDADLVYRYIVVNMPLSKIYTNSLLCMLNSSVRIRQTYRRSTYKVVSLLIIGNQLRSSYFAGRRFDNDWVTLDVR